jgi:anti-sigma factor RsiW
MLGKHVNNQLSAYHHGELAPAEARRVATHLSQCQACRAEYEPIKAGAQLAQLLQREAAPPGLWAQVEAGLEAQTAATNGTRRSLFSWFAGLGWSPLVMASATAVLLIGLGAFWFYTRLNRASWEVEALAGLPRIGAQVISKAGRLRVGEWLFTDQTAKARINVGAIGEVEIEPNSQVQLLAARATEHRLALQRDQTDQADRRVPNRAKCSVQHSDSLFVEGCVD